MNKKIFLFIISILISLVLFSGNLKAQVDRAGRVTTTTATLPPVVAEPISESETHFQPIPEAPQGGVPQPEEGVGWYPHYPLGINFYFNPILVDGNYQLKNYDTACVGDSVTLRSGLSGEWFSKGGAVDSPPVTFVSESDFIKIINSASKVGITNGDSRIYTTEKADSPVEKSAPEVTGIPLDIYLTIDNTSKLSEGPFYASVFCTEDVKVSNPLSGSNSFVLKEEGPIDITININLSCGNYVRWGGGASHGYSIVPSLFLHYLYLLNNKILQKITNPIEDFKMPTLTYKLHLNAVSQLQGAQLQIVGKSSTTDDNTTIMLSIQNTGDSNAILDNITSSIPLTITYKPSMIKPDETVQVYLQTSQSIDINSLEFQLSYRSETLGCQNSKEKGPQLFAACSSDSQCSEVKKCCQNLCRDSENGICRDLNGDGIPDWLVYK